MKKIAIVPTLLTLGNGICGFAAIACASKINPAESAENIQYFFALSGWLIFAAMIFDVFDGHVARLSKTASKFGGELDSLCDAVSFGVAPAFLLLKMGPGWEPRPMLHQLVAGIATLYMVCTILRLARFNVESTPDPASHKRFRGLPSPAAAGCLASLAVMRGQLPFRLTEIWPSTDELVLQDMVQRLIEAVAPVGAVLVALLMVSLVPYPHAAKQIFRRKRRLSHVVQVLLAMGVLLLVRELAVVAIFWGYALMIPIRNQILQLRQRELPAPGFHDSLR